MSVVARPEAVDIYIPRELPNDHTFLIVLTLFQVQNLAYVYVHVHREGAMQAYNN